MEKAYRQYKLQMHHVVAPVILNYRDISQLLKQNVAQHYKVFVYDLHILLLEKEHVLYLQYKLIQTNQIRCVFSVQFSDPFIWGDRDRTDAVYLHRIVVHPDFKGQRQFDCVLEWAKGSSRQRKLSCIRMDTWADNDRIINYYKSFGFEFVGVRTTGNHSELPIQNRNLNVALLEMKVDNK